MDMFLGRSFHKPVAPNSKSFMMENILSDDSHVQKRETPHSSSSTGSLSLHDNIYPPSSLQRTNLNWLATAGGYYNSVSGDPQILDLPVHSLGSGLSQVDSFNHLEPMIHPYQHLACFGTYYYPDVTTEMTDMTGLMESPASRLDLDETRTWKPETQAIFQNFNDEEAVQNTDTKVTEVKTVSKRKGGQIRFLPSQTRELESAYNNCKFLTPNDRKELAQRLELEDKQVKTWFQNRRAKSKRLPPPVCSSTESQSETAIKAGDLKRKTFTEQNDPEKPDSSDSKVPKNHE